MTRATTAAVEAVWRMEQTRLIAGLVRVVHDVGLLAKLGRRAEARDALARAATLTSNERERRVLRERAETLK